MVAMLIGPDDKPSTLHRTYLTVEGCKASVADPRRLMPGKVKKGSAVRLFPHEGVLGIAEGIETAFAAADLFGVPCWAAINSGMLADWDPPAEVREVIIFGDNDAKAAGQAAAWTLARGSSFAGSNQRWRCRRTLARIGTTYSSTNGTHMEDIDAGHSRTHMFGRGPSAALDHRVVLVPFDKREGLSLSAAAKVAGKSEGTLRSWAKKYCLGRRVGEGSWVISKVALQMRLDGNAAALRAYHAGDRQSPTVKCYYHRLGLAAVLWAP
jgi:hypothetical protein